MARMRPSVAWTFAISAIGLFMVALDNLVVTTALPVIRQDLGASLQQLEWMVNAYTLTFAVLLLTGAALGDRFGRRRMFVIGLIVFTAGSLAAALAPNSEVLILARAVQGIGGAIVTPLSLTILSAAVPQGRRRLQAQRRYLPARPYAGTRSTFRHRWRQLLLRGSRKGHSRIKKSPSGLGTRRPDATVAALFQNSALSLSLLESFHYRSAAAA